MSPWIVSSALLLAVLLLLLWGPDAIAMVPVQERQPGPRPSGITRVLPRRLLVVVPCFILGLGLSTLFGMLAGHVVLCVAPLAGPFIAPLFYGGYDPTEMWLHGGATALAMAAHPARPSPLTGLVTVVGCAWWLLLGLAMTYSGV